MTYQSTIRGARNGFWQILRAEWTKFWTVPARWVLVGSVAIIGALSMLDTGEAESNPSAWSFHLAHQTLAGDAAITARLLDHDLGHPLGAAAGIIVKAGTSRMAPYAALYVTPDRGVRLRGFRLEIAGSRPSTTPRWLRLSRTGNAITGYESADGANWSEVGTIKLRGLPVRVEAGLITAGGWPGTLGTARFDHIQIALEPLALRLSDVGTPSAGGGGITETDGVVTMTGRGEFGALATIQFHDSITESVVLGTFLLSLPVLLALGIVAATSEYSRGMVRTTFAASPRRGRVLAAKAVVFGLSVFALETILLTTLIGWAALTAEQQNIPPFSLLDPPMVKTIYSTALVLTGLGMLGLAAGVIARRPAAGVMLVAALLVIPPIISSALPGVAGSWLLRLAPGFTALSLMDENHEYVTVPPVTDEELAPLVGRAPDAELSLFGIDYLPGWAGFGVLCGWIGLAFAVATWQLRRRDA